MKLHRLQAQVVGAEFRSRMGGGTQPNREQLHCRGWAQPLFGLCIGMLAEVPTATLEMPARNQSAAAVEDHTAAMPPLLIRIAWGIRMPGLLLFHDDGPALLGAHGPKEQWMTGQFAHCMRVLLWVRIV